MPIIIAGHLTIDTATLRAHKGHALEVSTPAVDHRSDIVSLWCRDCIASIAKEAPPRQPDLPCGCRDKADHDEGVRLQRVNGVGVPRGACVGCYIGDDGPSLHSCVIHDRRYWA